VKLSEDNERVFDRLIYLAEKHHFNIYIVNSPIYEKLYEDPPFRKYYEGIQGELKRVASRSKNLHFIKGPLTVPKYMLSWDIDHLLYSGARLFTKELINRIQSIQARGA